MHQESNQELKILVEKSQKGNKDAFREIFDRFSDKFFAYTFSRTSNRDDALDIVQDTFIDLWKGLKKFKYRSNEAFHGFIFTIVKRKLSKHYKSKDKVVSLDRISEKDMGQSKIGQEDHQYVLKHVDALDPKYQDLLRLRYWSGMTFGEIASTLNITETNAKVRHHRALKKLKINLNKENYAF
ncbi:MAG: RNA polymerase sigma factor [Patescibacteria group bacterium]|nr:RNA polymerase sigma factor [Patescibacteria group bacterium]